MSTLTKSNTIWFQIPTGVLMSLGARQPVGSDNEKDCLAYLHFQVGNARKGLFKVVIRLNYQDTYDIQLVKIKRKTYETITLAEVKDVHVDRLGEVLLGLEAKLA